jgi:integrase
MNTGYADAGQIAEMLFADAAKAWLATRQPYISAKTSHEYELNIKTLSRFFGEMRLTEIDADMIRSYQKIRLGQCGPFSINHECSVLQQMLKRIGRWPSIAGDYRPLPLPKEKRGRVLTDAEKKRLIEAAKSNPNWQAAYLFAMISINTTAGPKEVATLRLKDVDLEREWMRVQAEGAKNVHRVRMIPLTGEALDAMHLAIARARLLGSKDPDHYIFPFRFRSRRHDPTRYQTTFKTAWHKLIEAAQLTGFRMYDLRHHAITGLLENPNVSEETVEEIAGHVSRRMKKQYSHIRMEAKRDALKGLEHRITRSNTAKQKFSNEDVMELLKAILGMVKPT